MNDNMPGFNSLKALTEHADDADQLIFLSPGDLDPDPNQDRTDWDDPKTIQHLADTTISVKQSGVRRPIEVKVNPDNPDRWLIIAGEVRWRSATAAELKQVPCLWRKVISDHQASLDMLTENVNKKNLKTLELARGLQRRIDAGISREELIAATGKSKSWISKRLSLLKMSDEVTRLADGDIVTDPDNLLSLDKIPAAEREKAVADVEKGVGVSVVLSRFKKKPKEASKSDSKTNIEAGNTNAGIDSENTAQNGSEAGVDGVHLSNKLMEQIIKKYNPGLMVPGDDVLEAWELFVADLEVSYG